jgi:hypothetical protein
MYVIATSLETSYMLNTYSTSSDHGTRIASWANVQPWYVPTWPQLRSQLTRQFTSAAQFGTLFSGVMQGAIVSTLDDKHNLEGGSRRYKLA